jgi:hypothetical protein
MVFLLSVLNVFAVESNVVEEPVSFSQFWQSAEDLRVKYSCSYNKENNPYFEFMFVVLDIEGSERESIESHAILSDYSKNLINKKLLAKNVVENIFSEVLCVTESSALVLNVLKTNIKPDGYSTGFTSVVKYDYGLENNLIKLKIHEGMDTLWYYMGAGIDVNTYFKIKFTQAVPSEK